MKVILIALLSFAVAGCATNPYQQFYQPQGDITQLKQVEFLPEGREPELYIVGFTEVDAMIKVLRTRGYVRIGHSSFNGDFNDFDNAKSQAKHLKAVVVIVGANYSDSQIAPLYMGGTVPIIRQLRRYDHVAIYFVRRIGKPRFGFEYSDLEPDQRQALGRNTGAVVLIVIEKTPAFYANVVEGDVIIAVDGIEVRGKDEAGKVLGQVSPDAKSSTLTVLRAGVEREIEVKF